MLAIGALDHRGEGGKFCDEAIIETTRKEDSMILAVLLPAEDAADLGSKDTDLISQSLQSGENLLMLRVRRTLGCSL